MKKLLIWPMTALALTACGGNSGGAATLDTFSPPAGTTHIARGVLKASPEKVLIIGYHTDLIDCIDAAEQWAMKTINKHESSGCSSLESFRDDNKL